MVLEEDVNINVKIKGSEEVLNFVKGYNKQIKTTQSMSYEETKEKSRVFNNLKREASLLNDVYKARGLNLKALISYNEEQDRYEVKTEEINTQNDGQKGKLDNLIKRYRWMQSFFLVTQNFVGMLGNSVKAFGAGVKMLLAPFILLLNLALIPALPYIKGIAEWALEGVKAFKDWQDENELLADALGITLFGAITLITGLGFIAWIGGLIGIEGGVAGLFGVKTAAEGAAVAVGTSASTGLVGALSILGGVLAGLVLGAVVVKLMDMAGWFEIIDDNAKTLKSTLQETFGIDGATMEGITMLLEKIPLIGDALRIDAAIFSAITGKDVMTTDYLDKALSSGEMRTGITSKLQNILGKDNVITGSGSAQGYWYNGGTGAPQRLTSMSQVYNISMQSSATDLSGLQNDITTKQRLLSMEKGG